MKVWVDQDLCTGDGLCCEIAPAVFALGNDGLSYVTDGGRLLCSPGGSQALAPVPAGLEDDVLDAAEQCPGECIFLEP
jgi:ferredoxin